MRYLSCFGRQKRPPDNNDAERASLNGGDEAYVRGCVFCDVTRERGFNIAYEDDELIVFHDRSPAAREHLLVIPRRHVSTVRELRAPDAALIERMFARARALRPGPDVRMGFHIPPFSSVHHIHLHVLVPPLKFKGVLKYPVAPGTDGGKGWSWFVTPSQVISILEANGRVGLGPTAGRKS
ncbi:Histidine triad nucleotide-binding protein 3 [Vanrija pseudolonga]|uniref:Histidine triad nucleotide-binding protein 3 n=1 Tax=Vanrija pseudolonga TaxID=143232 RepID=A0AAF1BPR0_9TREE|nr:Histidine triad nucleotide-binding protein 3 [Vanrija pseudolonga]